ncbi:hypothetical protein [Pragia fontium]|uniref:FidL-like membrane protein n=2 Tax=Pragia fontium TaxID=82985 RepID=A0ABQ5LGQ8_9GAMM|nr:hypothetical protein [Pragia fontium]AKJ41242.1 hypothetical protein QQ39_03390 [Pragia fontium]SFC08417.1 FidL-like putative membrane protein [Pragia fontium DSM 5563 = ATCC 49100]SUB81464.1 Uncharacterised protein [Pragia fontium]VEJ53767.1 Uncharacterised protein [Pragia fontium]GKX62780.1 hypothetical protein SOASR032_13490 [Pragia fontium]
MGKIKLFFISIIAILFVCIAMFYFFRPTSLDLNEFECKAEINIDEVSDEIIYKNLKISLLFKDSQHGIFNIYGYVDSPSKKPTKVARIVNFNYVSTGNRIQIEQGRIDKYNNDTASDDLLPEFLSNRTAVFRIEQLNVVDYIIYDDVSPVFVCSRTY